MGPSPAPVVIRQLTKRLGRVLAVDCLDLTVARGQVVGLAGPNGAGKSVTLKILLGLIRPTSGRVELFGEAAGPGARALARVGVLVDGPGFVPHLSGRENLRLGMRRHPAADLDRAIEIGGLGEAIDRKYHTYSHGMRYRLGLAQALLGRPELLLLDEPTTGLDPEHVHEIHRAIAAAAAEGATILLSSHRLEEVEAVCTHVAVMQGGRLVASGPVDSLVRKGTTVQMVLGATERAADVLRAVPGVTDVVVLVDGVRVEGVALSPAKLILALDGASVAVDRFRRGRSLEEAYLDVVGDSRTGPLVAEATPAP